MRHLAQWLITALYHHPTVERLFHTSVYCLRRELRGCQSVLDLGCGPDSPIQYCSVPCSVGVDAYLPYLATSKARRLHSQYICASLTALAFQPKQFDAVVMVEVLEHLSRSDGLELLKSAERWARQRVIVTTPNGFLPQGALGGNPYQAHRSGWQVEQMRRLGYRAFGMAGWRLLRKENAASAMEDPDALFATIRWRPQWLWLVISELTQLVTYYVPGLSFEVLYVRDLAQR